MKIKEWVEGVFRGPGPKLFLELGANVGQDTVWLAAIPGVRLYCFEPDPRNLPPPGLPDNVKWYPMAVGDELGWADFHLSDWPGRTTPYTKSSSLKRPWNHLRKHPEIAFQQKERVHVTTLDVFAHDWGLGVVDFIWADIQGAEREMILGGRELLKRTRWLYTEYSDGEMYKGQATLAELLALLPGWKVVQQWPDDVLLCNAPLGDYVQDGG